MQKLVNISWVLRLIGTKLKDYNYSGLLILCSSFLRYRTFELDNAMLVTFVMCENQNRIMRSDRRTGGQNAIMRLVDSVVLTFAPLALSSQQEEVQVNSEK